MACAIDASSSDEDEYTIEEKNAIAEAKERAYANRAARHELRRQQRQQRQQDSKTADVLGDTNLVERGYSLRSHGTDCLGELEIECDGTIAGQIWGAGAALGRQIYNDGLHRWIPMERPEVIEVGSGTGIAGLAAAAAGAYRVVLTDLPAGVLRLQEAIQRNKTALEGSEIRAAALEWGDAAAAEAACGKDGCDLVLAADVLYSGEVEVHAALRATLVALARPRDALILHAYEERSPHVVTLWRSALDAAESPLRLVRRAELEAPPQICGRSLILEELRVRPGVSQAP